MSPAGSNSAVPAGHVEMTDAKRSAIAWIDANEQWLSDFHLKIYEYAEPAWREYRSAAAYCDLLRDQGFSVEVGSGDMPTAFCATWGDGQPVVASYAEYDAVPGLSQQAVPYRAPRVGLHPGAPGHNCTHSMLGVGALTGVLAAKAAMEKHGISGTLRFFGEPAEKVCGSKPIHAAKGYYDELDAMLSYHPMSENTVVWDTHCGCYWSAVFTFECTEPEKYLQGTQVKPTSGGMDVLHAWARTPGAIDALCMMYTATKYTKEAMFPHTGSWTMNEYVMTAGEATSDNHSPHLSQIQYSWRSPTIAIQERMYQVLVQNARAAADITGCKAYVTWVSKTRPGLPNRALAELGYANMELFGPPTYNQEAIGFLRDVQKSLGLEVVERPMNAACEQLTPPEQFEAATQQFLPPWQKNFTSDDYTEYTWHAPTLRLYTARPGMWSTLRPPRPGYNYPDWVVVASGGVPSLVNPGMFLAGKTIAGTALDLLTNPEELKRAKAEFEERTGGGVGGTNWTAPLLSRDFVPPVDLPWPAYVTDGSGETVWHLPTPNQAGDREAIG